MHGPSSRISCVVVLGILILAAASPGTFGSEKKTAGPEELVNQVGQAVWTLEAAHRDLSPEPLDEDSVIDRIGRDPAQLCGWVRTHIAYEPYRGFLKGAAGTLISRRGNSADKALLLADLLSKIGFKVDLVEGEPFPKLPAAALPTVDTNTTADDRTIGAFSARTGISADRVRQLQQAAIAQHDDFQERLWNRTISDINTVATLLDRAKVAAPKTLAAPSADNHWWVRTASGDLDPTLHDAPPKQGQIFDPSKLPADQFHQVVIRMMIRQDQTDAKVLEASYRSAEIFGRTITVANFPLDAASKLATVNQPTNDKIVNVLSSASRFRPVIVLTGDTGDDAKVVSGKGFDLNGQQFDPSQGQVSSAQNLGGGLGGMFGGGGGQPKPVATKLTAAWIEIQFITPGQSSPKTIRRDLFPQNTGLTARQKSLDLLATREILLLPEEISDDYVTSMMLRSVGAYAKYLSNHSQKEVAGTDLKIYQGRPQFNSELYAFGVARGAALRTLCNGHYGATSFAHVQPTAVSYVTRFIDGKPPAASHTIDILDNSIVPLAGNVNPSSDSWRGNFLFAAGILDTALEHEVVHGGESHQNASVALEQSALAAAATVVINGAIPSDLKLGELARRTIQSDAGRFAFVVTPGTPSTWYQVDPTTGATLGYVEGGGGQEASEYAEMAEVLNQMIELIQFYSNLGRCLGASISGPLAGQTDWHENLEKCFMGACSMMTSAIGGLNEIETNWTNLILCKSISMAWENICEKLWDKLGGGEGGGGGEGAGSE